MGFPELADPSRCLQGWSGGRGMLWEMSQQHCCVLWGLLHRPELQPQGRAAPGGCWHWEPSCPWDVLQERRAGTQRLENAAAIPREGCALPKDVLRGWERGRKGAQISRAPTRRFHVKSLFPCKRVLSLTCTNNELCSSHLQ